MLNVLVPEVVLQGARVVAIVSELEPAGMANMWGAGGVRQKRKAPPSVKDRA